MRCYYHEDQEAVGVCKSCGKGLCRECAVDLTKGLACRGHCEADAQAVIQLIERNLQLSTASLRMMETNTRLRFGAAIFQIAMGALFIVWGLRVDNLKFIVVLGVGLIAYGVYMFLPGARLRKK